MPFAVSQWPYSPDPRTPAFNILGWDFGQVPPFSWIMSTTGATGFFSVFNDGVTLRNSFVLPNVGTYDPVDPLGNDLTLIMNIIGSNTPTPVPPIFTIDIQIDVFQITATVLSGRLLLLFPLAIAVQPPMTMIVAAPPGNDFPNPAILTPAKWDTE